MQSIIVDQIMEQLFNVTTDGIIVVDDKQYIISFNRGAEIIFGYTADEIVGQPLSLLLPKRYLNQHRHHIDAFAHSDVTSRRMGERREIHGLRRDGTEFPAEAGISKLIADGKMVFAVILRDMTESKQWEDQLRAKSNQLAVLNERNRLARELHDAVTQSLFSASIMADILPRLWESNQERGLQQLNDIKMLTRSALSEMRALLLELRPNALTDNKLSALLQQLSEAAASRSGIKFTVLGDEQIRLPGVVQIAFYRIAQEAMHNITKHSQATTATVQISLLPKQSMMLIQDDGRGFKFEGIEGTHLGLRIMSERAQEIGATLNVESEPGTGTSVLVSWSDTQME